MRTVVFSLCLTVLIEIRMSAQDLRIADMRDGAWRAEQFNVFLD